MKTPSRPLAPLAAPLLLLLALLLLVRDSRQAPMPDSGYTGYDCEGSYAKKDIYTNLKSQVVISPPRLITGTSCTSYTSTFRRGPPVWTERSFARFRTDTPSSDRWPLYDQLPGDTYRQRHHRRQRRRFHRLVRRSCSLCRLFQLLTFQSGWQPARQRHVKRRGCRVHVDGQVGDRGHHLQARPDVQLARVRHAVAGQRHQTERLEGGPSMRAQSGPVQFHRHLPGHRSRCRSRRPGRRALLLLYRSRHASGSQR